VERHSSALKRRCRRRSSVHHEAPCRSRPRSQDGGARCAERVRDDRVTCGPGRPGRTQVYRAMQGRASSGWAGRAESSLPGPAVLGQADESAGPAAEQPGTVLSSCTSVSSSTSFTLQSSGLASPTPPDRAPRVLTEPLARGRAGAAGSGGSARNSARAGLTSVVTTQQRACPVAGKRAGLSAEAREGRGRSVFGKPPIRLTRPARPPPPSRVPATEKQSGFSRTTVQSARAAASAAVAWCPM